MLNGRANQLSYPMEHSEFAMDLLLIYGKSDQKSEQNRKSKLTDRYQITSESYRSYQNRTNQQSQKQKSESYGSYHVIITISYRTEQIQKIVQIHIAKCPDTNGISTDSGPLCLPSQTLTESHRIQAPYVSLCAHGTKTDVLIAPKQNSSDPEQNRYQISD
ncbi:hypothetical protein KFK09_026137 [Dendrobium nobile]|uniref:Uncharacterized protein n=1 Tax=Dendrobium nobile TaxID=94219 RepID=A0A8T3A5R2_DENNO|nr:hypothetical protein KFK09_026137 [Dendrobium nobile]